MTEQHEPDKAGDLLTPRETAERLHVHPRTLIRMAERAELDPVVLPSGHRRYRREEVERIVAPTATPVKAAS
ncbi:MerR family DNA-binding transcriptional regulator [Pseudoclavibacter sp. RFBG4]|uniref:helix-turn-helix domain-containing protein n=1 Tax=Pseudoclavibacter sp. RFBG4 TaxID=2080575 RepID=UPI000CE77666|nr:helix-turn-helix domain-containing protein [Pseudoclavibacter sp. RFBG4]PPG35179.1 MerR family DNA-binding transcriptional regulator [Pseudoclavibacter sp. RFBG4]